MNTTKAQETRVMFEGVQPILRVGDLNKASVDYYE